MKLVVLSDTHGSYSAWKSAETLFSDADAVIHAGDILYHGPRNQVPEGYEPMELAEAIKKSPVPVHLARGNCDAEVDYMLLEAQAVDTLVLELEGITIMVNHGHNLGDALLVDLARQKNADLIVTGHTHIPRLEKIKGKIFLNPGSTTIPKGGFPATVAIVTSGEIKILSLEAHEVIKQIDL